MHVVDKRLIDFDFIEREGTQVTQRRIAGAEVIQRNTDAQRLEILQNMDIDQGVIQQHGFGDLHFQPVRGQAGLLQRGLDDRHQRAVFKLQRGQVYRHALLARPGRRFTAGFIQRIGTQAVDQPGLFGNGNKIDRHDDAPFRVQPAHQGLIADDLPVLMVGDRLIIQSQLAAGERLTQIVFDGPALLRDVPHPLSKMFITVTTVTFGFVQRHIRTA